MFLRLADCARDSGNGQCQCIKRNSINCVDCILWKALLKVKFSDLLCFYKISIYLLEAFKNISKYMHRDDEAHKDNLLMTKCKPLKLVY